MLNEFDNLIRLKRYFLILIISLSNYSNCQDYKNIKLLDHWQSDSLITNSSKVRYSGCWGFVYEGLEYGVIGSTEGHHIFQITDEDKLQFVDFIPGRYISSQAITREYKTYQNYLYASGDEGDGSLQIIDLSHLPDSVSLVRDLQDDIIGKIHTIFIDTTNALLYACSVTPILNGQEMSLVPLKVFSLQDPLNPIELWQGPEDIPEVHDVFVRNNLAILNCGYNGIRIYDFSNPSQPNYLSNLTFYQEQGYNHQGWLSPDNETYVFADETAGTRIKKAKLNSNHVLTIQSLFGTENIPYDKTAHNIQCTNEFAFVAYYNDGLRIFDLRTSPPVEIAYFDTHLDKNGNTFSMWGAWGVYALLPSERILVSDRNSGFYLFEFDRELFAKKPPSEDLIIFPNPCLAESECTIFIPITAKNTQLKIFDLNGKLIFESSPQFTSIVTIDKKLSSGMYCVQVEYLNYLNELETNIKKLIIE
jgi:choice-of-anchor B domain-containing protein